MTQHRNEQSQLSADWLRSLSGTYWTGLRLNDSTWVWSDRNITNSSYPWLSVDFSSTGCPSSTLCVFIDSSGGTLYTANCSNRINWICKRSAEFDPFIIYPGYYLLGNVTSSQSTLTAAMMKCLVDRGSCGGVVLYNGAYKTLSGSTLIKLESLALDPSATAYLKSVCSAGHYGDHCQFRCGYCPGGQSCNRLDGTCPDSITCHWTSGTDLCLHGMHHAKCPQNPGWWYWNGHCYYLETNSAKSWEEALDACRSYHGTELVTIDNTEEKAWLSAKIERNTWIGFQYLDQESLWVWTNQQPANFTNVTWLEIFSSGSHDVENCVVLDMKNKLIKVPCSQQNPWICKQDLSLQNDCPAMPGWQYWNNSCYYLETSNISTWDQALQICRRYRNTELLYLHSMKEKTWLSTVTNDYFWTGLNNRTLESIFLWTNGETLSPDILLGVKNDMENGDMKDCIFIDTVTGLLSSASCTEKKPFICKSNVDWFIEQLGLGLHGDPPYSYYHKETFSLAKDECQRLGTSCAAILKAGSLYYLLNSTETIITNPNTILYLKRVCASGYSGASCLSYTQPLITSVCDCTGGMKPSLTQVCGVSVESCIQSCLQTGDSTNCASCLPVCHRHVLSRQVSEKEMYLSAAVDKDDLSEEEAALISLLEDRLFQQRNLTVNNSKSKADLSKILYDKNLS
nr:PREDICTED: uncharacterized protein LOC102355497 [Latimeria chalumnae]|eukprot:XP_014347165.1 PREDICTED: uncharacterized protein LOC102355497 [Latimeria chalumnae]